MWAPKKAFVMNYLRLIVFTAIMLLFPGISFSLNPFHPFPLPSMLVQGISLSSTTCTYSSSSSAVNITNIPTATKCILLANDFEKYTSLSYDLMQISYSYSSSVDQVLEFLFYKDSSCQSGLIGSVECSGTSSSSSSSSSGESLSGSYCSVYSENSFLVVKSLPSSVQCVYIPVLDRLGYIDRSVSEAIFSGVSTSELILLYSSVNCTDNSYLGSFSSCDKESGNFTYNGVVPVIYAHPHTSDPTASPSNSPSPATSNSDSQANDAGAFSQIWTKAALIGVGPFIVVVAGVGVLIYRRKKESQKEFHTFQIGEEEVDGRTEEIAIQMTEIGPQMHISINEMENYSPGGARRSAR